MWQPIPYWLSTAEVSGADVAETSCTVFAGDKKHARTVALIVRPVRPTPGSQLALFTTWGYHAFVTDRPANVLELEADHRRHAIVEQTIAELKSAGLAHMPSGNFMANAAWLALAVMAHNLGRAIGHLARADLQRATAATLRRKVFTMPGRLVHTGRQRRLRLPESWPWAVAITTALDNITPRSRCAAEPPPRPNDQDLGEAGRPAAHARPHAADVTAPTRPRSTIYMIETDGGFGLRTGVRSGRAADLVLVVAQ